LLIKPLLDYYYKFYTESVPGIKGSPLHDVFPIWYLMNKDKVTVIDIPTKIIVDKGDAFGQSIADYRYMYTPEYTRQKVAIDFNTEEFQRDIIKTLHQKRLNK
jgi:purine nucleosidase